MIPIITNWESSAAALLYDLLKVHAQELGNIVGDYLRYYRMERLNRLYDKFRKQKEEKHMTQENMRTVSPKLGIPLLNAASLEDDEVIQDIWARLLLNAADANFTSEIRVAFVDIIKTLTSVDVQILQQIHNNMTTMELSGKTGFVAYIDRNKAMNVLNIDAVTFEASLNNLERCQLLSRPDPMWEGTEEKIVKILTALGILFVRACISDSSETSNV